jgi:hypothetical protein
LTTPERPDEVAAASAVPGESPEAPLTPEEDPWFGRRPFVGRSADLARLHAELNAAMGGDGRVLFLLGEPGTGKTTLIRAFSARVRDEHWLVKVGYGDASDPDHDAWIQLARHFTMQRRAGKALLRTLPDWIEAIPVVGRIVRAILETAYTLSGRRRGSPVAHPRTGSPVEAVRLMLEHGPETPRLIILDNMEVADAAELSGAFALIRDVTGTHTLLLIAAQTRGGDLRRELADLLRESERLGVAETHRLAALSAEQIAEALEQSRGGETPPAWRDWFAEASPMAPGELWDRMGRLVASGAVRRDRRWWWTGLRWTWQTEPPAPQRRVVELPTVTPEEHALLAAAASLGEEVRVSDLVRVLGTPELEMADELDRLARRGILEFLETRETGDDLTDVYRFPAEGHREAWRSAADPPA